MMNYNKTVPDGNKTEVRRGSRIQRDGDGRVVRRTLLEPASPPCTFHKPTLPLIAHRGRQFYFHGEGLLLQVFQREDDHLRRVEAPK